MGGHELRRRVQGCIFAVCLVVASLLVVPRAGAAQPGTPKAWGANPYGQLGDGTTTAHPSPLPVSGLSDVVDLAGGRGHVIALRSTGTVVAWGQNSNGQVGDGTTTNRLVPTAVTGLSNVIEVATGHYHSMALRSDGTVWTWGMNTSGQLGDGTTTRRTRPVQVTGLTNVIHVAGGRDMSYALRSDGTVWAWGLNTDGELGDGTTTMRTRPVQVSGLVDVIGIAGGRDHGLAIRSDGTVWSWGDNQYGQLGDGLVPDRSIPAQVPGLSDVVQVAAGAHHSVALRGNGTVSTWGRNSLGQLGDGTTTLRRLPVPVNGLAGVAVIGSGRDHVLAVLGDGTVRAWGRNDFRQLGDGTTTNRTTPVVVNGLSDAVEVHGGQDYSVVLTVQGDPDISPPTTPGQPSGQSLAPGTIDLTWDASHDDVSTTLTYRIFRDGTFVGSTTSASTTTVGFTDTGLTADSTHTYTVVARDAALNDSTESVPSEPITVVSTPAPIFADDFSSGTFAMWTSVTRLTIDGTLGSPSPPSARVQVSGLSAYARTTIASTSGPICISERVNVQSRGANAVILGRLLTSSGSGIIRVTVNASGVLQLYSDVSGVTRSSGVALGTGWVSVEMCGSVGSGSVWDLYRNGVRIVNAWSANTGATPVGQVQIGDNTAKTVTMNLDDVVVDGAAG
jgi:alpha-tubulin suppressor-like RCC1 family protein